MATPNIFDATMWTNVGITALEAAIIAAAGYIVGWIAEIVVRKVFKSLYYEEWFEAHGVHRAFLGIHVTDLLGLLAKWWVFLGFFAQAVNLFGLSMIAGMAEALFQIYTDIAIGIIYLAIGAVIATYVGIKMRESGAYGGEVTIKAVQAIIWYFAIVSAMPRFGITNIAIVTKAVEIALWAIAIAFAFGMGLAIGLGSQDVVREVVKKHKKEIEEIVFGKK